MTFARKRSRAIWAILVESLSRVSRPIRYRVEEARIAAGLFCGACVDDRIEKRLCYGVGRHMRHQLGGRRLRRSCRRARAHLAGVLATLLGRIGDVAMRRIGAT